MRNVGSIWLGPQLPDFIRVKFSILKLNSCVPVNFSMSAYLPTSKKIGAAITLHCKAFEGFGIIDQHWIKSKIVASI